ncbi:uncharacterized protein MELLADRAFT_61520 [Melampsora larici-populina 98AG31]|uniref:RNase H type-1 domain-containing protein n=1 Tax=Melampsora larici-populina (strain 98AG31 / pathotype 3-4-7) TaxID=747676 RepID=F4RF88_MELLP|nr:uncharacterized protein MELLADRAFT_61520 [Melampsora larici-populina 98AG31]EGG08977.1 hypothetical protein MELLADRAFT_61520 [Melampsora larici-populina 98AG31]
MAILRLLELPDSNPAAKLVKTIFKRNRKTHRSSIHQALAHPLNACRALPGLPEALDPVKGGLKTDDRITGLIHSSKEEAVIFTLQNITERPANTVISSSDGSHIPGKGVGAAALTLDANSLPLRIRIGEAENHTPYDAKLAGIQLAIANVRNTAPGDTQFFWFITDCQNAIQNITKPLKTQPGMSTCIQIRKSLNKLLTIFPRSKITIIWCLSSSGVQATIITDEAAKTATTLHQILTSAPSTAPIQKTIKANLQAAADQPPPEAAVT